MVQPTTDNPTLAEALQVIINQSIGSIFVSLPGKVISYNAEDQTANIKPLIQHNYQSIDGNNILDDIPVLQNIPVIFQRGGGFFMSYPLNENDKVLIVFNDRSIDKYMSTTSQDSVDPVNFTPNGLNGAVCIPGFFQTFDKLSQDDSNLSDMMIGQADGGMKIRIKDTVINIENSNKADKSAALAEPLKTMWEAFKTIFDNHVHPTGTGPSGVTATQATAFDDQIISNKLKIADN